MSLFTDDAGHPSLMRVIVLIVVLTATYLVVRGVELVDALNTQGTAVVLAGTALFPIALGAKVLQKAKEE
jgi:hypothetical protein